MNTKKSGRRLGTMVMATLLSGVVVSSATILKTSIAAFSATTSNGANSWSSGTLNLASNPSSVLFTSGGDGPVVGGQVLQKCIRVHYTGSWTGANVKMYASLPAAPDNDTALAPYLSVAVEQGSATDTTAGTCANFTGGAQIGTTRKLDSFISTYSNYATGVGTWSTGSTDEWMAYRITITVDSDDNAQGKAANATFTWEVQR